MNKEKLPILLTTPRKDLDFVKNSSGGSKKPLCELTPEIRNTFFNQLQSIEQNYISKVKEFPEVPCVGKVIMKDKAIAKSHKPNDLLNKSCPIIGTGKLDEIYIKLTANGIDKIKNDLIQAKTQDKTIQMTKIDRFEFYNEVDSIKLDMKNLKQPIKIKLFDYKNKNDNDNSERCFLSLIKSLNLENNIEKLDIYKTMKVYKLNCNEKEKIMKIAQFQGVKSMDFFPKCSSNNPKLKNIESLTLNLPKPIEGLEYPIVGLIDSGISKNNKYITPWIYKTESYVDETYINTSHGTFVAGVMLYGKTLNMNSSNTPSFKILDVVALPNSNSDLGPTESLSEESFLLLLEDVLDKYSDKVKVWNLSLSTNMESSDVISDLAIEIDDLQKRYNVHFFIAAGNYTEKLREWPLVEEHHDRITIPGDSVKSITVGSIALEDGLVSTNEPSPFTRRGPGANFINKPTVVDYGGNINSSFTCDGCGIVSFDENGNLVEDVGTSFSTPFVTSKYQDIVSSIQNDERYDLAKALLIHSCTNPIDNKCEINSEAADYYGFGIPSEDLDDILKCEKSKVTLIFEGSISTGQHIEIKDIPYPKSLYRDKKWYGEILITLLYNPPLDGNEGQEYCRSNVDLSMGIHRIEKKSGLPKFSGQVPLEKSWTDKFEKERVENGFKWSPLKRHYRNLKNGLLGENWKLRLDCTSRNNMDPIEQKFIVVITITSDDPESDIYSEVYTSLRERGFIVNNLQLKNQFQARN